MPGGAPKGNKNASGTREFHNALRKEIANGGKSRLPKMIRKLLDAADDGQAWALQMVADRLDGKPAQIIEGTGTDGQINISITSRDAEL